jgi:hypothetical protein
LLALAGFLHDKAHGYARRFIGFLAAASASRPSKSPPLRREEVPLNQFERGEVNRTGIAGF